MNPTLRAFILAFVVPPMILAAYVYGTGVRSVVLDYAVMLAAAVTGLMGLVLADWSRRTTVLSFVAYLVIATVALPLSLLLMVCSTGDCL